VFANFGFPGDIEFAEMFGFYKLPVCLREPEETRRVSTGKVHTIREWVEKNRLKFAAEAPNALPLQASL